VRYAGARQEGLSEDKITALDGSNRELFTPREGLAVRFAELLAADHHKIDEVFFAELKQHFSDAEIVELGVTTALFLGLGRFTAVLGVDPY
jgi:alkylhydroperoxidase family enzyme